MRNDGIRLRDERLSFCEYDLEDVILINWENIFKHNEDRKYKYTHIGVQGFKLYNHSITTNISIFLFCFVILGI